MSDPLALGEMARLVQEFPRPKQYELRCHPFVITWLRVTTADAVPSFPGAIGSLTGIPVIGKPDMEPYTWEMYEDGEMIKSGRLTIASAPNVRPPA